MNKLKTLQKETQKLLDNDIFLFNKTYPYNTYFPDYISNLFEQYTKTLNNEKYWLAFYSVHYPNNVEEMIEQDIFRPIIKEFSDKIILSIEQYYLGKVGLAYYHLCEALNKKISFNKSVLFKQGIKKYEMGELKAYRMRTKTESVEDYFCRKKMFHIPFEKREIIPTQRFSIPGHPSLYLGDSTFVCWKELNEPQINQVYVSKYTNSKTLKIIELLSKSELRNRLSKCNTDIEYSSTLFRFLLLFPLNIACSVKTKNNNAIFKCEYIIPQLFLQYISEHKESVDGIKYYSTKIDEQRLENISFNNFVLPTKSNKNDGYCDHLNDKLKLSEPILWEYEMINNGNVSFYGDSPRKEISLELIKGRKIPYDYTTFKAIENVLETKSMNLDKAF